MSHSVFRGIFLLSRLFGVVELFAFGYLFFNGSYTLGWKILLGFLILMKAWMMFVWFVEVVTKREIRVNSLEKHYQELLAGGISKQKANLLVICPGAAALAARIAMDFAVIKGGL